MNEDIVLDARGISKTYETYDGFKTVALNNLNFKVRRNEMLAVMGRSGSGKSTLINVITGIMAADQGQVYIDDEDVFNLSGENAASFRRRHIGIVFQKFNLIDSLTIDENIRIPLIIDDKNDGIDEKVMRIAQIVGISDILHKYPYEVSGGQQQRAGICRALINEPEIIFADEPTGNLDANSTDQVMDCFTVACRENESSMLIVTHDAKVASYCDRVIFLKDGCVALELGRKSEENADFYTSIMDVQKEVLA